MDKKTAQELIEKSFNNAFSEEQFTVFAKNLLNDLEDKDNRYSGNLIWDDYKEHINTYKRIGKYIDPDGEALDVLIVEVKSVTKLERARTALRNFVIKHLSKFEKDYALVAFYSKEDDGADWRFSFIKLEYRSELDEDKGKVKTKKEFTPAQRYSFLVGKYEKAHTAKNQLLPLLQNISNNPTIEELESAFSIEKVTDEFFNQYKDLYIKLYEHFENDRNVKSAIDQAGIDNARFTKKLLGQIVFLYFLQKKGWLGVAQNARWGTGKKRFVQELFDQAQKEKVNFFKDKLQYLFYEALAKERDNVNSYYDRFKCRIPFLNGGLFEADYVWRNADITIPENLFRNKEKNKSGDVGTGILDVFDRYNFTIKEDEPLDKEVAVDPEMLGKVFENMLDITERKSKGAFYTPREIVHYMCQESLLHYLDNALNSGTSSFQELGSDQTKLFGGSTNKNGNLKIELEHTENIRVPRKDIETFIREGHFALENDERVVANKGETKTYQYQLPESIRKNADLIDQKLSSIKICDPAIGSGAFPVGLLHELVNAMLVLKPHLSYDYLTEKLKGFDFTHRESIIDSRYIYRLKRHIIQESIYGVDIDSSAIDIARLRLWLSLVVDEDDLDPIETLPNLDYKIVPGNSLIGLPDGAMKDLKVEAELEKLKEKFYDITDEKEKKALRQQINTKIRELLDSAEQFAGYKIDFDFKLFFSEVWREKGGFDVVIGNPPYYQLQKFARTQLQRDYEAQAYQTFSRTGDIYELFYEKGYRILKPKGSLIFITSNKWMRAAYGKSTRQFFTTKTNPLILIDFGNVQNFDTATVDTNILQFERNANHYKTIGSRIDNDFHPSTHSIYKYIENRKAKYDFKSGDEWVIVNPLLLKVKLKVESQGIPLSSWKIDINYGLKTGLNEAFIIDGDTRKELINKDPNNTKIFKPLLRGRDIIKWQPEFADLWLIYIPWHFPLHEDQSITGCSVEAERLFKIKFPFVYQHLEKYKSQLENRNQVEVNIRYEWYALQRFGSNYWRDFEKPKIIYPNMTKYLPFLYDKKGAYYTNDKSFIFSGSQIEYLCCFFNSELFKGVFSDNFPELQGGTRELRKVFVEKIPVKPIDDSQSKFFESFIEYLIILASNNRDSILYSFFDSLNDAIIYELYFPEDIKSAGKEILKHLGDLKPITDDMSEEKKLAIIQSEFERLYDPNHPVRFAIETLDSVEEVRIIKEALK
jgi:hypothetical protein